MSVYDKIEVTTDECDEVMNCFGCKHINGKHYCFGCGNVLHNAYIEFCTKEIERDYNRAINIE